MSLPTCDALWISLCLLVLFFEFLCALVRTYFSMSCRLRTDGPSRTDTVE